MDMSSIQEMKPIVTINQLSANSPDFKRQSEKFNEIAEQPSFMEADKGNQSNFDDQDPFESQNESQRYLIKLKTAKSNEFDEAGK